MTITAPDSYLVTGGAGFIGSHLVEALLARGHGVQVVDNLSTGSMDNIAHLLDNPRLRFTQADITDDSVLDRAARDADIIVHLAAAVGVRLVVNRPAGSIETNVMGTHAVLQAALRHRRRIVLASSSEVYGKGSRVPFSEDDDVVLGPTSRSRWGYAASKMLDEFLALGYAEESGLEVVPVRLFNTIGPRQVGRYGMVIPRFTRQALSNEPITVYGDGTQSRCFCDVQDVVRALIVLAGHPEAPGRVFNIGGTEETTIRDLAERIRQLSSSDSPVVQVPYSDAYPPGFEDMQRRVPDTGRIRSMTGWQPSVSLDESLLRVRDWMKTTGPASSRF